MKQNYQIIIASGLLFVKMDSELKKIIPPITNFFTISIRQ